MRGLLHSTRLTAFGATVALCTSAVGLAACGNNDSYKNRPRPPAPIVVTAAILPDKVSVSPAHFGAGSVVVVVTNQTAASQRITVERNQVGQQPFSQQTSPINPHGTASLKANLDQGDYAVKVDGTGIKAAKLRVGAERPSAQNDLLQP